MAATDTLKKLPVRAREMLQLLFRPRVFVTTWKDQENYTSNKEVLAWSLAFAALLFGLYSALSGSDIVDAVLSAGPMQIPVSRTVESAPKPKFGGLGWRLGAGVGIDYPESPTKGRNGPQMVVFNMGAGQMSVLNVIPSKMGTKVSNLLLLSLYVYFLVLCIYPGFRVWKTQVSFKRTLALTNLYLAAVWAFASALLLIAVLALIHVLRLRGWRFLIAYALVVILPMTVLSIRAFWSGFRTLAGLSRSRFFVSLLIAWCISWVVFPVFAPFVFAVLQFQALLDTVL